MATTVDLVIKGLTMDELLVLTYVIPQDTRYGDPLKDIYELERDWNHGVDDQNQALKGLNKKFSAACAKAKDQLVANGRP